jgi:hypothetical protein
VIISRIEIKRVNALPRPALAAPAPGGGWHGVRQK